MCRAKLAGVDSSARFEDTDARRYWSGFIYCDRMERGDSCPRRALATAEAGKLSTSRAAPWSRLVTQVNVFKHSRYTLIKYNKLQYSKDEATSKVQILGQGLSPSSRACARAMAYLHWACLLCHQLRTQPLRALPWATRGLCFVLPATLP